MPPLGGESGLHVTPDGVMWGRDYRQKELALQIFRAKK